MTNKTIAYFIFASIASAFIASMLIDEALADLLYSIAGLGFIVFGTWGAVRLYKSE